ncbi:MAG: hypothetical protein AAB592_05175 [Patescibacteria group bacterium]
MGGVEGGGSRSANDDVRAHARGAFDEMGEMEANPPHGEKGGSDKPDPYIGDVERRSRDASGNLDSGKAASLVLAERGLGPLAKMEGLMEPRDNGGEGRERAVVAAKEKLAGVSVEAVVAALPNSISSYPVFRSGAEASLRMNIVNAILKATNVDPSVLHALKGPDMNAAIRLPVNIPTEIRPGGKAIMTVSLTPATKREYAENVLSVLRASS